MVGTLISRRILIPILVAAIVTAATVALSAPATAQTESDSMSVAMAWAQKTDKKGKEKKGKEETTAKGVPESGGIGPTEAALWVLGTGTFIVAIWVIARRSIE
jgi:hypothetical protein